jgi:hypothetical protein
VPPLKTGINFVEVGARNEVDLPDGILTITSIQLKIDYE